MLSQVPVAGYSPRVHDMSRSGTCGVVIKQCHVRRRSPAPASPPSLWCRLLPWKPCSAHVLRLAVVCLASSSHVCESNMRNNRLRLCCRACQGVVADPDHLSHPPPRVQTEASRFRYVPRPAWRDRRADDSVVLARAWTRGIYHNRPSRRQDSTWPKFLAWGTEGRRG